MRHLEQTLGNTEGWPRMRSHMLPQRLDSALDVSWRQYICNGHTGYHSARSFDGTRLALSEHIECCLSKLRLVPFEHSYHPSMSCVTTLGLMGQTYRLGYITLGKSFSLGLSLYQVAQCVGQSTLNRCLCSGGTVCYSKDSSYRVSPIVIDRLEFPYSLLFTALHLQPNNILHNFSSRLPIRSWFSHAIIINPWSNTGRRQLKEVLRIISANHHATTAT